LDTQETGQNRIILATGLTVSSLPFGHNTKTTLHTVSHLDMRSQWDTIWLLFTIFFLGGRGIQLQFLRI
jgi:hypothetical protein